MTRDEAIEHFKKEIELAGGKKAWATKNGFTPGFVHDVVAGRKPMSDKLLTAIGLTKTYEKIDKASGASESA